MISLSLIMQQTQEVDCLSREVSIIFEKKFLLNALLMCGTDCRHLSTLHHCQHSGEQYRKLILVSS